MVRITLMDGSSQEVSREQILGFHAMRPLFTNPHLKADALTYHEGALLPVLGPLGEAGSEILNAADRPWLVMFASHAQIVRGFPTFDDEVVLNIVPVQEYRAPVLVPSPVHFEEVAEETRVADMFAEDEADEEAKILAEIEDLFKLA